MTSPRNPHGGQEQTILSFYASMIHWGAIIAAPGSTDPSIGNLYGTSVTVDSEGNWLEDVTDAVKHQARRTVKITQWIKDGQEKER